MVGGISAFVFATERGGPFTPDAINKLIKRIGARAGFAFPVHVHMLRHACGYALANAGHDTRRIQDWLGHRSIQHTTRYTQLSAAPFRDFWREGACAAKGFIEARGHVAAARSKSSSDPKTVC
jgi:site-specific recombinase XerD